jgi:alpha-beta hydrolase superfamily lysophospholipase
VVEDGGTEASFPSVSEAAGITAPTLLFHGSTDTVVDPATSLHLQTLLLARGMANNRIVYDTSGLTGGSPHSIQNVPAINTDMLVNWRAWLISHGVLP